MPTYDFLHKETGEVTEHFFSSWEDKDAYLAENPQYVQTMTKPPMVHSNTIGGNQHGKAFREVLNKIHNKTPGSQLNKTAEI